MFSIDTGNSSLNLIGDFVTILLKVFPFLFERITDEALLAETT